MFAVRGNLANRDTCALHRSATAGSGTAVNTDCVAALTHTHTHLFYTADATIALTDRCTAKAHSPGLLSLDYINRAHR